MSRSELIATSVSRLRLSRARAAPRQPWIGAKSLILKRPSARASVAPERTPVIRKSLIYRRPSRARVTAPYYVRGRGACWPSPFPIDERNCL